MYDYACFIGLVVLYNDQLLWDSKVLFHDILFLLLECKKAYWSLIGLPFPASGILRKYIFMVRLFM